MRLLLFPTVEAPGEARTRLEALGEAVDKRSLTAIQIVVSELLAISISHGASSPIGLLLEFTDHQIEGVMKDGPGVRALARARERRDDSLVLRIIGALVDDWGTDEELTRVWFRMPVNRVAEAG